MFNLHFRLFLITNDHKTYYAAAVILCFTSGYHKLSLGCIRRYIMANKDTFRSLSFGFKKAVSRAQNL